MISERLGGRTPGVLALVALALVLVAAAASLAPPPTDVGDMIVIEPSALGPPALNAVPERRVTFVNRTGRMVHIEFNGGAARHHVIQVPDQIWAIFHRAGSHPYVVHFPDDTAADMMEGVVEIVADPHQRPDPEACVGVTVMGACLER